MKNYFLFSTKDTYKYVYDPKTMLALPAPKQQPPTPLKSTQQIPNKKAASLRKENPNLPNNDANENRNSNISNTN